MGMLVGKTKAVGALEVVPGITVGEAVGSLGWGWGKR